MIEVECGCGHKTLITNKQWKTGSVPDLCYECYKKRKTKREKRTVLNLETNKLKKVILFSLEQRNKFYGVINLETCG